MNRKITIIISLLLALILLTGCGKENQTIRLGSMPTYSAAIYAVGIENGYFEEAGVTVDLTVFKSSRERDGAATSGELDGFMTDIMGAVNMNEKGFPFIMTSREWEDFGVMANEIIDINDVSSLQVGIAENTVTEFIVDTYIQTDVEKVNLLAIPDRMGAVLSDVLDSGVFPQPFMGIIMGKNGQQIFSTASNDFHPVVLVFDESFINENEADVIAFYEGYKKTVEYMQSTDYNEYKSALVSHGLATNETVDHYRLPVNEYGLNAVDENDFDAVTAWMLEKELLGQSLTFEEVCTTTYVND